MVCNNLCGWHTFLNPFLNEEHISIYAVTNEMHLIEALSLGVHRVLELNTGLLVLPKAPFSNLKIFICNKNIFMPKLSDD